MKLPIIGSNFFYPMAKKIGDLYSSMQTSLIYSTIIHIPVACSKNWDSTNNIVAAVVQSTTFKSQILKSRILSKSEIFFNFITHFYFMWHSHTIIIVLTVYQYTGREDSHIKDLKRSKMLDISLRGKNQGILPHLGSFWRNAIMVYYPFHINGPYGSVPIKKQRIRTLWFLSKATLLYNKTK